MFAAGSGLLDFAIGGVEGELAHGVHEEEEDLNGEQVEKKARQRQWAEFVRMGVSGVGFTMGVVGIWGDGA